MSSKLYSDERKPWISVLGTLYQYTGNQYRESSDEVELKRILDLANKTSVVNGTKITYPFASAACVKAALDWVKISIAKKPEDCNPPGLNCTNGVLTFDQDNQPVLKPHDPSQYFLYEPTVKYDPNTPTEDCDRLLAALDSAQLDVWLKTVSAAFNIDQSRRKVGRVRALLLRGTGSNGKDAHREAISLLFGRTGVTSVALEDFAEYDSGRKFPLSCLLNSRVNWASENRPGVNLDKTKSLIRAITGESLHFEQKGKDIKEFSPKAIQLFNVNEVPNIKAGYEAIKTRFAVISYDKTYKVGADISKGEIEADTRFKYDQQYVIEKVLPSLLNRLVKAYQDLMTEGIDYSCCDRALEEIQIQNSHLFEFALETGLTVDPDSILPIGELWSALEDYYRSSGVLIINSDGSKVWEDPIRPRDLYVKGANQIPTRFLTLYPQTKKVSLGGNRFGIKGLRFGTPKGTSSGNRDPVSEPASDSVAEHLNKLVAERLAGVDLAGVDLTQLADQITAQIKSKQPEMKSSATTPKPEPEQELKQIAATDASWQPKQGERVWAWSTSNRQWLQGELVSVPNTDSKDPTKRVSYWQVKTQDGTAQYIWERGHLAPLTAVA